MKIIYFDGVCGLCNGVVDFVMKIDKKAIFKFSPLQSEYASSHLPPEYVRDLDSVALQIDDKIYRKSQAVFKILDEIGGPWKALSWLKVLPAGLSDRGYDLVASSRYKIFGKKDTCRLPTPEERTRFLL